MHEKLIIAVGLVLVFSFLGCTRHGQQESTKYHEKWHLTKGVAQPESVYYDAASKQLFVSNISGRGDQKDGKGWIQKLSTNGKVLADKWVNGLNAPKGLRAHRGVLWVADIDELLSIDIRKGKILSRTKIKSATFLNDVAIDASGRVFVSDTPAGKIYQFHNGKVSIFDEGEHLESPNGLLVKGNELIVAGWGTGMASDWSAKVPGRLYAIHLKTKKKRLITKKPLGNLDGVEIADNGRYLVSDWRAGKVYEVTLEGQSRLILDGFKGAADIGYVPKRRLLIVPRMLEDRIDAYQHG